ncbi:MAG TPA: GAF domain-containing protein [Gemmatimonadales bacterium]|nr:GAF domain-containing protein [Gemmatimonadales bacterium]
MNADLTPDPVTGVDARIAKLGADLRHAISRALVAEHRVGRLAQLLAAVAELHSGDDAGAVVTTVKEIVANLVGCEEMGVFAVQRPGPVLTYVDGIGIDANAFATIPASAEPIAAALATPVVLVPGHPESSPVHGRPVTACVPLVAGGQVFGLIVLFRLVLQKPRLNADDLELLRFLSDHASRALGRVPGFPGAAS